MTAGRVVYESKPSRSELIRGSLFLAVLLSIPAAGLFMLVNRPRPPARPAGVPPTAAAFLQLTEPEAWWWGQCEELALPRYRCRLYGPNGAVQASGEYLARAGQCRVRSGAVQARLPNAGEYLEFQRYEPDTRQISLRVPCGVVLDLLTRDQATPRTP
jgi:hypothetical protein